MAHVRPASVAGSFYPADPTALRAEVERYLADASARPFASRDDLPLALVAPHAGYVYSGPVAGSAYASLRGSAERIRRVVVLGPAHYVAVCGLTASTASAFATPLGNVLVDEAAVERVLDMPGVGADDHAHAPEHSLEVHLPFLQSVLHAGFAIVPLLAGRARDEDVVSALDALWDSHTLIVVSTDLSHFLPYDEAARRDARTAEAVEHLDADRVGPGDACGRLPLRGLLRAARARGLTCRTLDLRSSGDTAGARDRVVGYGAFVFV